MRYRALGRTGLDVSALSFGASSLGGVFRAIEEAQGIEAVHAALEGGMNLIDVSPYYGLTKAETVLGKALRGIDRDQYVLATKFGRYGDAEFDFSAARVAHSLDESLARLGVEHIDIFQAHDIEFGDLDQIVQETLPAMQRLKDAGKARFIGITGLPLIIFTEVLERVGDGTIDTVLSYCHYELNDTALLGLLPALERRGVGVMNASPLGTGLLSSRGTPDWHPAPERVKRACARAAAHCSQVGADLAKLAIQFSVRESRIPTTLVGTASPRNIQKNLRWIEEPIDEELLAEVRRILEPVHNVTWPSGRP